MKSIRSANAEAFLGADASRSEIKPAACAQAGKGNIAGVGDPDDSCDMSGTVRRVPGGVNR